MIITYINVAFFINNFEMTTPRMITGILLFILMILEGTIGVYGIEGISLQSGKYWTQWILLLIIGSYQIHVNQNMNNRMFMNFATII